MERRNSLQSEMAQRTYSERRLLEHFPPINRDLSGRPIYSRS